MNATGSDVSTFKELWREYLKFLGAVLPTEIVPIQKTHLVAMDPNRPKMSGASEPLDCLLERVITEYKTEVIVIAWDLTPPWDPDAEENRYCRWNETKKLYQHLAESEVLSNDWKASCRARSDELAARGQPSDRAAAYNLRKYGVVAICMEPEFEGLLAQDESQVMRTLGLHQRPNHWPKRWGASGQNPKTLLQKAVVAARKYRHKPTPVKQIHGDMRTAKHEWGLRFLRALRQNKPALIDEHPLSVRLAETLC